MLSKGFMCSYPNTFKVSDIIFRVLIDFKLFFGQEDMNRLNYTQKCTSLRDVLRY